MIQRVYEGALKSSKIALLIVATDDERIVKEVLRFGGNVEMTKNTHQSGTDRCAEVAARHPGFDVIINIQGDEPLVDHRQLDLLINAFQDASVKIASIATKKISTEELSNPNRIKVLLKNNNDALYFSRNPIPYTQSVATPHFNFLRHIGLYAFFTETLMEITALAPTPLEKAESLEQLRWLFYDYAIRIVETEIETPNIDSPEDVDYVISCL